MRPANSSEQPDSRSLGRYGQPVREQEADLCPAVRRRGYANSARTKRRAHRRCLPPRKKTPQHGLATESAASSTPENPRTGSRFGQVEIQSSSPDCQSRTGPATRLRLRKTGGLITVAIESGMRGVVDGIPSLRDLRVARARSNGLPHVIGPVTASRIRARSSSKTVHAMRNGTLVPDGSSPRPKEQLKHGSAGGDVAIESNVVAV